MLKFLIFLSILSSIGNLKAEDVPFYLTEEYNPRFEYKNFSGYIQNYKNTKHNHTQSESRIIRRDYDVLAYDIEMDWRNPLSSPSDTFSDRYYNGKVGIKLQFTKATDKLILDIGKTLAVSSVKLDGKDIDIKNIKVDRTTEELVISNLTGINTSNTYSFLVEYQYIGDENYKDRSGFFLYRKGLEYTTSKLKVEEKVAYTMSEPQDARNWVICNDHPHDKAIMSSKVIVPEGFVVGSNGIPTMTENTDKSRVFSFAHKYPISTYLMSFAASKFDTFSHTYTRKPNSSDLLDTNSIIPVNYYVWKVDNPASDTVSQPYNAKRAFKNMVAMLEYFSEKMIPYPFETYAMTAVAPFPYGGMEHQTNTTINRSWVGGNEAGIAHELGHHWFGNLVTCATWQDLWQNEGGATWTEALWAERNGGRDAYNYFTFRNSANYLNANKNLNLPAIADVSIPQLFTGVGWPLVYQKAGFVYHMLRALLGDEAFFKTMREYHLAYKYNYIETSDFADFWASKNPNLPVDLKIFIDQFTNKPGHPKYELTPMIYDGVDQSIPKLKMRIKQVQSEVPTAYPETPEVFIGYIDLVLYKDTNNSASQVFRFPISTKDTLVEIPNLTFTPANYAAATTDFLCSYTVAPTITSIESDAIDGDIIIDCQTNKKMQDLRIANLAAGQTEIQLLDLNGRIVKSLYSSQTEKGGLQFATDLADLTNGVYFISVQNNNRMKIAKVSLID